jgi:hypothetical protein
LPIHESAFEAMSKGWAGKIAERITQVLADAA